MIVQILRAIALTLLLPLVECVAHGDEVERQRLSVRVPPQKISGRNHDERPVAFQIDKQTLPAGRRLDPATLRVVRWDSAAKRASSDSLALRWYDDAVPHDFPECEQNAHATDGLHLQYGTRQGWGDFYNLLGEGAGGRLVWLHRQERDRPGDYLIEFALLPAGELPRQTAPRGLVGDGCHRCAPVGSSTTGLIHTRVGVADLDCDGLQDLVVGSALGHVISYSNVGTASRPDFAFASLVLTDDGRPLDVGWSSTPLVVDWDCDGAKDLLIGAERNCVLFFRNVALGGPPRFANQGFVKVEGEPLTLPVEPVPKSPPGVYKLDYYPVLDAADLNGDGRLDLLAGGYITGRIYFYENEGEDAKGYPRLAFRGPLMCDGEPLNVGDWAAAPCLADFDSDGDVDLVSGNMALTAGGGDTVSGENFLRYYENVGTARDYRLTARPFPKEGQFPISALATPRAADFNGDGLLDLAVSAGENIYLYFNQGRRDAPLFAVSAQALPGVWSSAPLPTFGVQFVDFDGDGRDDLLSGLTLYRKLDNGDYRPEPLLAGQMIDQPATRGDGWTFTQLADLDRDGRLDLLFGTHDGEIWFHRNLGGKPVQYDDRGHPLLTTDGQALHVGPSSDVPLDFNVLQGARTAFTCADFDGDGFLDLVVGNTYGKIRYFRNDGSSLGRFALPREMGDMKIRLIPAATDWDKDGHIDVLASAANGEIALYRNRGGGLFEPPAAVRVPAVPYSPMAAVTDFNGDGDEDLVVGTAYGYFCWFERSFLEGGYLLAEPSAGVD